MKGQSPRKGMSLGHREFIRCRILFDLLKTKRVSSEEFARRYYTSLSSESFHKTFKRDREALAAEGIYLTEHKEGSSKMWSLDREKSLAAVSDLAETDRLVNALLLRAAQTNPAARQQNALGAAIARIGQTSSAGTRSLPELPPLCNKDILTLVTEAFEKRVSVKIEYKSAADTKAHARILRPYGLFSLGRSVYVVGLRSQEGMQDEVRTYNLERISKASLLGELPTYLVPSDFSIEDYRLLPFEIGDETPQTLEVHVEASNQDYFASLVGKRGTFEENSDGSCVWKASLCNSAAAARWAIEVDVIPLAPQSVTTIWASIIKEALND